MNTDQPPNEFFSLGSSPLSNRQSASSTASKPAIWQAPSSLDGLDLRAELLHQYITARRLSEDSMLEEGTPLNQKAQLLNTLSSIINQVLKMQSELHSLEEMKYLEEALIDTLQEFPQIKAEFLKRYKGRLSLS